MCLVKEQNSDSIYVISIALTGLSTVYELKIVLCLETKGNHMLMTNSGLGARTSEISRSF